MTVVSQTQELHSDRTSIEAGQLAFGLSFAAGKGLLTSRDVKLGPFDLQVLELEIPNLSFPFDVTGGAERFKTRRCELKRLSVAVSGEAVAQLVAGANAHELGFIDLKSAMRDGHIELAGRLVSGSATADFTLRVALIPRSPDELAICFYDMRVYGSLPLPAPLIPTLLRRALDVPFLTSDERPSVWVMTPGDRFVRTVMPLLGWKVPDTSKTAIAEANISRGQLSIVIGPQGEPNNKQKHEHEPPVDAVLAHEGASMFDEAERALGQGKLTEAYELYRSALDDDRGSAFVRERLLQIGVTDPEMALETRMLASEMLAVNPADVQALLALASIALRDRSYGEAVSRFEKLGEIARQTRARFDAIAAELAIAGAAAPIDSEASIAGYERAAARARDSIVAHRALFDLLAATGEIDRAIKAGDRLSRLERQPSERAKIYKRLGGLARQQLNDLKKARVYYERALKLGRDDPEALEGLAETYAARGEPARAATYLARLAEQAEETGDDQENGNQHAAAHPPPASKLPG
ncbi:MAG: tetratricopeptide repeat protein [Clostridia bacterium]|nr:tetratricopeptide repeat protein [Deltaproteobacteria bacterium]